MARCLEFSKCKFYRKFTELTGVGYSLWWLVSCLGQRECAVTDRDTTNTTPPAFPTWPENQRPPCLARNNCDAGFLIWSCSLPQSRAPKTLFQGKEKHAGSEERVRNSKTPMTKYIVGAVSSLNSHFNGIPRDVKEGLLHTVTQMNRCCRACPHMGFWSRTFGSPCSCYCYCCSWSVLQPT